MGCRNCRLHFRFMVRWRDRQHRSQHVVRPIGGKTFQAGFPGVEIEILKIGVGVIFRHVHRFRNTGINERRDCSDHLQMRVGGNIQRRNEIFRQRARVAAKMTIQAPGMVFDQILLVQAVGGAFFARVCVRKRRLNTVRGIVGEGE